jgi:hypothetical protein
MVNPAGIVGGRPKVLIYLRIRRDRASPAGDCRNITEMGGSKIDFRLVDTEPAGWMTVGRNWLAGT